MPTPVEVVYETTALKVWSRLSAAVVCSTKLYEHRRPMRTESTSGSSENSSPHFSVHHSPATIKSSTRAQSWETKNTLNAHNPKHALIQITPEAARMKALHQLTPVTTHLCTPHPCTANQCTTNLCTPHPCTQMASVPHLWTPHRQHSRMEKYRPVLSSKQRSSLYPLHFMWRKV